MNNKDLKDFDNYLKENWDNVENFVPESEDEIEKELTKDTDTTEATPVAEVKTDLEEVKGDEPATEGEVKHEPNIMTKGQLAELAAKSEEVVEETPAPTEEVNTDDITSIGTPLAAIPVVDASEKSGCKVVVLNGTVTSNGSISHAEQISLTLINKLCCDTKEVKLFQLNIQPVNDGEEPNDGMTQVYEALIGADAIILVSDVKKGQISSVLQSAIERIANHYKLKELRNVIFGAVIAGEEDSHQQVKSTLLNFANNMGLIIGGDCNVFCCVEEGNESCEHNYEADSTNAATCIKELCEATKSLRSSDIATVTPDAPIATPLKADVAPIMDVTLDAPAPVSEVPALKSFDEFEKTGSETEVTDAEIEKEVSEIMDEETPVIPEEEESYDYQNDIVYNPLETPMSKPNKDEALPLPKEEKANEGLKLKNFNDFLKG